MPEYKYKAITDKGQVITNRVDEVNKQSLIKKLKTNNLLPIEVTQVSYKRKNQRSNKKNIVDIDDIMRSANSSKIFQGNATNRRSLKEQLILGLSLEQSITTRDVIIFTQNFYLLKKANFNNIHALSTIINSTENLSFRGVLEEILAGVESGDYMYTTMELYPNIFPYIYISMIKVGELSGSLTKSLEQAVRYLDETTARNKKIKSIVVPNIVQFVAILLLLVVSTIFVLPEIENIFSQAGLEVGLPPQTKWFMNAMNNLKDHWYIPIGIIGIIAMCIVGYTNTPKGKYNWHYFKYTVPLFGKLIYSIDFSRLMRAMLLNLQNGMRIQEALEVSKSVVKNYVMLAMIETSINNILVGGSWIEPFEKSGFSSSMEIEMLKIGMQTDLSEMMGKLLEYMDVDINNTLSKIMKVLPEISYLLVGTLLIFLVVVVIVPCIELYMGDWLLDAYDNGGLGNL